MRTTKTGLPRHDGHKMSVTVPTDTYACIEWLAQQRRFGTSASDVAAYLIMSGVERFMSLGILPPGIFASHAVQDLQAFEDERDERTRAARSSGRDSARNQRRRRTPTSKK